MSQTCRRTSIAWTCGAHSRYKRLPSWNRKWTDQAFCARSGPSARRSSHERGQPAQASSSSGGARAGASSTGSAGKLRWRRIWRMVFAATYRKVRQKWQLKCQARMPKSVRSDRWP